MEKHIQKDVHNEIRYHAERCLYYNGLLIEQCDNWLSEEEGFNNMMKAYEDRRKAERNLKTQKFKDCLRRFLPLPEKKTIKNHQKVNF